MHILLIIYFLLFLFISIKNLKLGIYWIIFTLPAYLIRFEIFYFPTTLLEIEILLLFLIWISKKCRNMELPCPERGSATFLQKINKNFLLLYYFITLLLTTATISIFISPNLTCATGIWKAYFIEPILFLIIFVTTLKREDLKSVFVLLCSSVFVLSIFAIYQKLTGAFIANPFWQDQATRRVTSFFPYPNALALYLAPLIILLLGHFIYSIKNKIWKLKFGNYLEIGTCILVFATVYFTKSKGAMLAILSGIIFYTIFYKTKRKIFIGILICVFVFLCFSVLVNGLPNLQGASTVEGGDSINTRIEMWSETWEMLKTKPILGAGLAGYQTAVAPFHEKEYIEIYLYPHNIFLNFWSEIGLLGLISFLAIIVYFYIIGFKIKKQSVINYQLSIVIMSSMTALLIHGLVDVPYFKNDLSVLFWILVGIIIILNNNSKTIENKNY